MKDKEKIRYIKKVEWEDDIINLFTSAILYGFLHLFTLLASFGELDKNLSIIRFTLFLDIFVVLIVFCWSWTKCRRVYWIKEVKNERRKL